MYLLSSLRPLQKIFDAHLVLLAKSSDEFNQIVVSDQDIKKELKQHLQLIQILLLYEPE